MYLRVWGFGVAAAKEVAQGARRGDLGISGVEHHTNILGDHSRLDAVVQLRETPARNEWLQPTVPSYTAALSGTAFEIHSCLGLW